MKDNTTDITIGPDGIGRRANGVIPARFVDSFTTAELVHPGASVICLRLYDRADPRQTLPEADLIQLRLAPDRARALARMLQAAADLIEGRGAPRQ